MPEALKRPIRLLPRGEAEVVSFVKLDNLVAEGRVGVKQKG
jgi:hypothetical protein